MHGDKSRVNTLGHATAGCSRHRALDGASWRDRSHRHAAGAGPTSSRTMSQEGKVIAPRRRCNGGSVSVSRHGRTLMAIGTGPSKVDYLRRHRGRGDAPPRHPAAIRVVVCAPPTRVLRQSLWRWCCWAVRAVAISTFGPRAREGYDARPNLSWAVGEHSRPARRNRFESGTGRRVAAGTSANLGRIWGAPLSMPRRIGSEDVRLARLGGNHAAPHRLTAAGGGTGRAPLTRSYFWRWPPLPPLSPGLCSGTFRYLGVAASPDAPCPCFVFCCPPVSPVSSIHPGVRPSTGRFHVPFHFPPSKLQRLWTTDGSVARPLQLPWNPSKVLHLALPLPPSRRRQTSG